MKKIYAFCFAALGALSMQAADFQLIHDGKVLTNDETYEVGYETYVDELAPGLSFYTVKYDAHLMLQAPTSTEMTVQVFAAPEQVQFCGLDGNCLMAGPTGAKKTGKTTSDQPQDLLIDLEKSSDSGYTYLADTNELTVIAYPTANPDDQITVYINFVNKPNSEVGAVTNLSTDLNAPVSYFNLQGQRIANPQPGQMVIRQQGSKAQKILFR